MTSRKPGRSRTAAKTAASNNKKTTGESRQKGLMDWGRTAAGKLLERVLPTLGDEPRKRPIVESLEQRLLLSTSPLPQPTFNTTLSYAALPTGAHDVTLEVVDTGGPNLTLRLREGANILGQEALDENVRVAFTGSVFNDKLTVNLNYADSDGTANTVPWAIKIDFDGGTDVPLLTDDQLVFAPTGSSSLTLGGLFVTSTDDVLVNGPVKSTVDIDIHAK